MAISTLTFGGFRKTLIGSAQRLSDTSILVTEFELHSLSTNSGNVFIGDSNVNSTDFIPRAVNSITNFSALDIKAESRHFDLKEVYVTGTLNDIIVVQYRKEI